MEGRSGAQVVGVARKRDPDRSLTLVLASR